MTIKLRPYQEKLVAETFEAWERGQKRVMMQSPTGSGKCLALGTPVLMADGSINKIEDIVVGDRVMGDDGEGRNVLSLKSGVGPMYKISPVKGDSFVVADHHILSLQVTGRLGSTAKHKIDDCRVYAGSVVNIRVSDYLRLPPSQKHLLKLYRRPVDSFEGDRVGLELHPYVMGVWLADGIKHANASTFCLNDENKADVSARLCKLLHPLVGVSAREKSDHGVRLRFKGGARGESVYAQIKRAFCGIVPASADLYIPVAYKTACRAARVQLLSGILDGDGYLGRGSVDIVAKSKQYAQDIAFVARSLGLAAYVSRKIAKLGDDAFECYRLSISGDFSMLGCVRLAMPERKQIKSVLRTGFKVAPVADCEYRGISIDGNHRYLLGDFTATHNTTTFADIARQLVEQGKTGLLMSHRTELVDQGAARLELMSGKPCGIIQGSRPKNRQAPLQSASVASLASRLDDLPEFDFIITDEGHHAAAKSYRNVYDRFPNALNLAVTATPIRTDGSGFDDIFDTMVCGPQVRSLIDGEHAGSLSRYRLIADPNVMCAEARVMRTGDYNLKDLAEANNSVELSGNLVGSYLKNAPGQQCLVFAINVAHAEEICKAYAAAGISAAWLDGKTKPKIRNLTIQKFKAGALQVVVNCGLFTEGTDIPGIECVQIARPTASLALWLQMVGRGLRLKASCPVKTIIDHTDNWFRHGLPCRDRKWSLEGVETIKADDEWTAVSNETGEVIVTSMLLEEDEFTVYERPAELVEISQDPEKQAEYKLSNLIDTMNRRRHKAGWLVFKMRQEKWPLRLWRIAAGVLKYPAGWAIFEHARQEGQSITRSQADAMAKEAA